MKSNNIKIRQSIHLSAAYFSQEFCIDLNNKKIIPTRMPEPYNHRKDPFYGEEVYYMMLKDIFEYNASLHDKFCDNAIKKEYDLLNEDCKKITDFFNNKKSNEKLERVIDASITADNSHIHPNDWGELNNILKDIVNLDVLNLQNIVSQSDYDFKKDGIYYKGTSEKLKLKTLCFYNRNSQWLDSDPQFAIDFDENKIRGCINKDLSDEDISLVLEVLEKYLVYQWSSIELWKKAINDQVRYRFDGTEWQLELIFEDDKVFDIGGYSVYPDVYVDFGEEVFNRFGKDFLRLNEMIDAENEFPIYKKYAQKHLNNTTQY